MRGAHVRYKIDLKVSHAQIFILSHTLDFRRDVYEKLQIIFGNFDLTSKKIALMLGAQLRKTVKQAKYVLIVKGVWAKVISIVSRDVSLISIVIPQKAQKVDVKRFVMDRYAKISHVNK